MFVLNLQGRWHCTIVLLTGTAYLDRREPIPATWKRWFCTASLDLGVDFRPVETVIQVGSPKGVARFLQRAGRSGYSPDAVSKIYFLPTHSLELMEAAALKFCHGRFADWKQDPMLLCYDVLMQYLNTLAISDGFDEGCFVLRSKFHLLLQRPAVLVRRMAGNTSLHYQGR